MSINEMAFVDESGESKEWQVRTPVVIWPGFWMDRSRTHAADHVAHLEVFNWNFQSGNYDYMYGSQVKVVPAHMIYPDDSNQAADLKRKPSKKKGRPYRPRTRRVFNCDVCEDVFRSKRSLVRHVRQECWASTPASLSILSPRVSPILSHSPLPVEVEPPRPAPQAAILVDVHDPWQLVKRDLDEINRGGRKVDKKCSACGKRFDRKGDLKRHLIEHVLLSQRQRADASGGVYFCNCCERSFDRIDAFKADLRDHFNLTSYHCSVCNKSFSDSSNFSKHKKVHGLAAMQCDTCRRKFNTQKMMTAHMLHHRTAPPVRCHQCDKTFCFESQLRKHAKAAHGVGASSPRTATTTSMGRRCQSREAIAGGGAYGCGVCGERFGSLRDKWTHAWRTHGQRRAQADCWQCPARFRIVSELRAHFVDIHGVTYTCKYIRTRQIPSTQYAATASDSFDLSPQSRVLEYNTF